MRHPKVYSKYLHYLSNYTNTGKIGNILLNQYEARTKRVKLSSRPYKITIDPGNFCNLRCPGCHTGIKHPEMIEPGFMKLNDFKTIFSQLEPYAISVALYNWGEPFLNKQIFDMIAHATEHGVGTTLHSNFNVFNAAMAENAVKSGLTHIYMSIDGSTQEAYSKYRVRGNLEHVMDNLKLLLETRKRLNSKFPIITWKFLEFAHNAHEKEEAKRRADLMGVDAFEAFVGRPKLTDIYDEAEAYKNSETKSVKKEKCPSLWSSIYVNADGAVLPCSLAYRENEVFGNLLHNTLDEIWNNDKYIESRKIFRGTADADKVPLPCKACKYYLMCKGEDARV
jgi:radical SAM protein with 4Fe4S-binding SPASM domain